MSGPEEDTTPVADSREEASRPMPHTTDNPHNDPFAPREGKHLRWRNVNMTVQVAEMNSDKKKTIVTKTILDNVWGEVPLGETTAILGPSGSGKSSLLNALSGRVSTNPITKTKVGAVTVQTDVRLNNFAVDPTDIKVRQAIAFVAQDDSLQATATVREAILFSAKLRLSKHKTDQDLDELVTRMITELGLVNCADTIVGSALIKGISGGERKRTSVGVELVTQPPLVFLDEPTSGLDSYSAMQLGKVLKKVARAGSSVLFTIHQPSSEIFKTFDHVLLLKGGRLLYTGSIANLPDVFEQRGFPVPIQYNPADWIMEVAQGYSMEELEAAGFFRDQHDPKDWGRAATIDSEKMDALGSTLHEDESAARMNWIGQTKLLFAREVTNFGRNKHALKARTAMTVAISVFIGIIFFEVAETDFDNFINVQSSFGALLMALLANVFSTTLPSLLVFPQERPVFLREYSTNHYSVVAYFMSRLTMEFIVTAVQVTVSTTITYFCVGFQGSFGIFYLVIYLLAMTSTALGVLLGSSAEDPSSAIELLPGTIMPQILFAGFFVPPDLMPDWLAWIRFVCPLTYAVHIALVNEFDGRCDDVADPPTVPNYCDRVLSNADADPDETWWNWIILSGMFVVLRLLALINLRRKASKFY